MNPSAERTLAKFFQVIGIGWTALAVLVIIASVIGMFLAEPSLFHGWKRFQETFNPFNIGNTIAMILLFLPGVGAFKLKEYFENRGRDIR